MSLFTLFAIAVGLSMDAFSVAICKGLSMKKVSIRKAGIVSLYFGTFQAGMPLIGYFLGVQFQDKIVFIDHWIAFILLGFLGIKMILDSRKSKCEIAVESLTDEDKEDSFDFKSMSVLAIATSIDALAVGVTFAFLKVNIVSAVSLIGIVTFIFSMVGVRIGSVFGTVYKSKAEFAGGLILILIGTKLLFNHIEIINF